MNNLAYDPLFMHDATMPYVPCLTRAPKGKKMKRQEARQRFWLTIVAALLLGIAGPLFGCVAHKPRKNPPSWAQREAQLEQSR